MTRVRGWAGELSPQRWRAYLRRFRNEHLVPEGSTKLRCRHCRSASCGIAHSTGDGHIDIVPLPKESDAPTVRQVEMTLRCGRRGVCGKESKYKAAFVLKRIDDAIRTAQKNVRLF